MRTLGIDPGTLVTGYGVVEGERDQVRYVASGGIRTRSSSPLSERLKVIYDGLTHLIDQYQPQEAAIESIFHARNAQSALKLGHARGVALLAAVNAGLEIAEYLPSTIRKAVVGSGRADKEQVLRTVEMLLGHRFTKGYDASDALAVAICHFYTHRISRRINRMDGRR